MRRRAAAALATLALGLGATSDPASAGAGRLAPVQDRHEPGGRATLVGYTAGPAPGEPFYAYLRRADDGTVPALDDGGVYVGELVVRETGRDGYLGLRVSLTFDVPPALEAGEYEVTYCDDPCTGRFLGDLVPSPLSIGLDPLRPVTREWAADEPEIANLAPGAVVVGPGFQATAGALRAPPTTAATPPAGRASPVSAPAPAPPATGDGDMAWPLPTALVLASAGATALVLGRRHRTALRAAATRPQVAPTASRVGAGAGRG